jgi:penicillin-binding protein 2
VTETRTRTRLKVLAALVVVMFAALTTRLWFLQVLASPKFVNLANENQVRLVPISPLRGQILDRTGKVLVGNRASTVILVDRRGLEGQDDAVLFRLSNLLHVPVSDMLVQLKSLKYLPYQPVPIAADIPKETVFYIQEHRDLFPGVSFEVDPIRQYPDRSLAAQALGYVLPISAQQLKEPAFKGYRPSELVGYSGLEAAYEQALHGKSGYREIQVNAQGQVLNDNFGVRAPVPGDSVVLSLDEKIQELAQSSLQQGIDLARRTPDRVSGKNLSATGGAVVVMDPRNGQIVAMASYPSYDPSVFLGGLNQREFNALSAPNRNVPLVNRAIQGVYPAGSTFKPFVAVAALKEGFAKPNGTYPCPPAYYVPGDISHHAFNNWSPLNYGNLTLPAALAYSCDTVFYKFGYDFWLRYFKSGRRTEYFQRDLGEMGFGRRTGIDLPGEQAGLLPTAQYLQNLYARNPQVFGDYRGWVPGESVNLSIGQGFLQVTPMQLAVAFSAIANGGTIFVPHVASKIMSPDGDLVRTIRPQVAGTLPIPPKVVAFLRNALTGVTTYGTAHTAFRGFPLSSIPVAGKTGTADIVPKQPTSWFGAMAPANNPRYVVVAMVEQGGHGATTAAPIVRRILEGLFGLSPGGLVAGAVVD